MLGVIANLRCMHIAQVYNCGDDKDEKVNPQGSIQLIKPK
jgi:hypothetical protein